MKDFYRLGTLGIIALVALRVAVGWHFFKEGTEKIQSGTFSSEGFLKSSEGRFADLFQGLVWDADASIRLDEKKLKSHFEQSIASVEGRLELSQQQIDALNRQKKQFFANLDQVYSEYSAEIKKYQESAPRVEKMSNSPVWSEISSLRGQRDKIKKERLAEVWPAVDSVDALIKQFEKQLNYTAYGDQQASAGQIRLSRPGEGVISSRTLDRIIPVFDMTIGVLLMIGLFVPLAGWLGALFLLGVILSQFPGDANTQPTYYQSIEALALITLASIGAGRFAGLDFFTWSFRQNRKAAKLEPASTAA